MLVVCNSSALMLTIIQQNITVLLNYTRATQFTNYILICIHIHMCSAFQSCS